MPCGQRTALITGSGQNIGRAIALHLAKAGFNVVINGSAKRDACEAVAGEAREAGVDALVAMGDIGDRAAVHGVAEAALNEFGRVDVLVNNAAVRPDGGFLEMSEDEWNRVLSINFNAPFWLSRACLPGMVENGWGRIINFTGMNAQQGYAGKPHVTVSKHAVWGLTKTLAKEFGRKGVTTNIISPGTIVGEAAGHSASAQERLLAANPSARLGHPDDIACLVDLLVSDGGSFINGQLLQVNGGVVT
ncbi:MAG: SDR family oxidoreductase [Gammaproteobacteria bacterium]|nr:SDR family oxidoreductase [Gammaproteobacteria bacterium]